MRVCKRPICGNEVTGHLLKLYCCDECKNREYWIRNRDSIGKRRKNRKGRVLYNKRCAEARKEEEAESLRQIARVNKEHNLTRRNLARQPTDKFARLIEEIIAGTATLKE